MGLRAWLIKKAVVGKLPLWLYLMIGRRLAKILKLEDTQMGEETTDKKHWYRSKAKWAAIVMVIISCVQPVSTAFGHPVQVPLWVIELLTGLGIYGVRDAINK